MKLAKRYSQTTCWMDYQSCRVPMENADGTPVPWWGELILTTMVPLLILLTFAVERLAPQFAQ